MMRIGAVAGEASGDLLGAGLLKELSARYPNMEAEGIGGPQMLAAGLRSLYPMERLSVMGLVEALGRYAELLPVRARLRRQFAANPPDVFIGIDSPDFNLTLERGLRRLGVPTVHYVSPSVWAWRQYRIGKIARSADLMLTLFPFEADFYRERNVRVAFVGHPLADLIPGKVDRDASRLELGLPERGELIALLPGSRMSEVKHLSEPMIRTAEWLVQRRPGLRFIAPLVDSVTREYFQQVCRSLAAGLHITILEGRSRTAMSAADVVLLASGTASLEALLLRRPMVITYRMSSVTYRVMKTVFHAPHIGLPNLLAGRTLVPELIQDHAAPEHLGPAVLKLLTNPERQSRLTAEFARIHGLLRQQASARAADAVLGLLQKKGRGL